jgi:hypothetical protein
MSEQSKITFEVKPYTMQQLRKMYDVSYHVWRKLIAPFKQEIGKVMGYTLTVRQVEIILSHLGVPGKIEI